MNTEAKNGKQIYLSRFKLTEVAELAKYLDDLKPETKHRFGPHTYDATSITNLYQSSACYIGYTARETEFNQIVSYCILKIGYLEHDRSRLESYGLQLNKNTDCTFAPSVSDDWQSLGIGKAMLEFITTELKLLAVKRVILWGGVQASNELAIAYYRKQGFNILGQFEYHGINYDMILEIH